jgi:hypothetical protein
MVSQVWLTHSDTHTHTRTPHTHSPTHTHLVFPFQVLGGQRALEGHSELHVLAKWTADGGRGAGGMGRTDGQDGTRPTQQVGSEGALCCGHVCKRASSETHLLANRGVWD